MSGGTFNTDRPRISAVIPVFNEEACLDALITRVSGVCRANCGESYEIVLVNDGSSDRSWSIIAAHADEDDHVVGIDLARNYGHQIALSAGLQSCRGMSVFVLDADLQDPPELLPQMMEKMADGYDVVYGKRLERSGETWFKRTSASLFYRALSSIVDVAIPRDTGDFRLMNRRVVDHLNAMPERYRFVRGMISWIGFSQIAFPYEREARYAGTTHYPLRKMISFALDAVTSFSILPLRFASHLGFFFGIMGLASLVWVGYSYFSAGAVAGWTSLAALVLILGSIQLLLLGIFGEYLGRMYVETKQRPLFLVRELKMSTLNLDKGTNPVHALEDRLADALRNSGTR